MPSPPTDLRMVPQVKVTISWDARKRSQGDAELSLSDVHAWGLSGLTMRVDFCKIPSLWWEVPSILPLGLHLDSWQSLEFLPLLNQDRTPQKKLHLPQLPKMEVQLLHTREIAWSFWGQTARLGPPVSAVKYLPKFFLRGVNLKPELVITLSGWPEAPPCRGSLTPSPFSSQDLALSFWKLTSGARWDWGSLYPWWEIPSGLPQESHLETQEDLGLFPLLFWVRPPRMVLGFP